MSTPQNHTTKGPRRSGRKTRNSSTPVGDPSTGVVSDTDTTVIHHLNIENAEARAQSKRKSYASRNGGHVSDGSHYEHSLNQPSHLEKTKATPIKQAAYAGPTFHQSPAASALPIPSFYSKSVPNANSSRPSLMSNGSTSEQIETIPTQEKAPSNRESTPLDFLFEAARQAKGAPRAESPLITSEQLRVPTRSPASRSPGPRDGDSMFPFELDGAAAAGQERLSSATPFKDRVEAVRSTRSTKTTSENPQPMDEYERKAKSDALKKLLMNSHNQPRGGPNADMNNPFNARAPVQPSQPDAPRSLARPHSGPSTPSAGHNYSGSPSQAQYFPNMPYNGGIASNPYRPPSSNLRNVYGNGAEPEPSELSSDGAVTSPPRISTARKTGAQPQGPSHNYDLRSSARKSQQQPSHRRRPQYSAA